MAVKRAPWRGAGSPDVDVAIEDVGGETFQRMMAQLEDASGNKVDVKELDGDYSLAVVPGHIHRDSVHFDIAAVAATTGYMLVDLSDTTTWPHGLTGHLDLHSVILHVDPDSSFLGDVIIGFLADVDADNGDFHHLMEFSFERASDIWTQLIDFGGSGEHLACKTEHLLGDTDADDTTWQTAGADIAGPAGGTHPCGAGDLVMKIVRNAGTVDVSLTLLYEARAT